MKGLASVKWPMATGPIRIRTHVQSWTRVRNLTGTGH